MTVHDQPLDDRHVRRDELQEEPLAARPVNTDPRQAEWAEPQATSLPNQESAAQVSEPYPSTEPYPSSEPDRRSIDPDRGADASVHHGDGQLIAGGDLSALRARWDEVQAGFVDDPRECVHRADGLISDVVDQLTASFSQTRAGLAEQWAHDDAASTEELRVALTRYRDLFQRLLTV